MLKLLILQINRFTNRGEEAKFVYNGTSQYY